MKKEKEKKFPYIYIFFLINTYRKEKKEEIYNIQKKYLYKHHQNITLP